MEYLLANEDAGNESDPGGDDDPDDDDDDDDCPDSFVVPPEDRIDLEWEEFEEIDPKTLDELQEAALSMIQNQTLVIKTFIVSSYAMDATVAAAETRQAAHAPAEAEDKAHPRTKNSQRFFQLVKSGGQFQATKMLVAAALHRSDWAKIDVQDEMDVAKFFLLAKNIWMLPKKGRQHMAPLLGLFQQETSQKVSFLAANDIWSMRDLDRLVLRGKYSFMQNVPHPSPVLISATKQAAYVSVIDSIAHMMHSEFVPKFDCINHGESIVDGGPVRELSQSKKARELFDGSADYNLIMRTWQDGFEANYNKANRLKAWIKTGTLSVSQDPGILFLRYPWRSTFPISMGYEHSLDNLSLERAFYKDMEVLSRPGGLNFYHGGERKVVSVAVHLLIVGGDQPERRDLCGLVGVNGVHGPAFGCIGNYQAVWKNVPSCSNCMKQLVEKTIVDQCENCLNWDVYRQDTDLNLYDPPVDYPKEEMPIGITKLRIRKVCFEQLKVAANKTHQNIVNGKWPHKKNSQAYLHAHALNTRMIEGIISSASRARAHNESLARNDSNQATIAEWRDKDPTRYQEFPHPPIWDCKTVTIDNVVCLIMHLLFLGMTKHMFDETHLWLGTQSKREPFIVSAKGVLESIQTLHLPWCKILPYNKGTGGSWVSENYLAMAKLMPWFFSMLTMVKLDERDMEIEKKPYSKNWTKTDCQQWLKHRNLPLSGKAEEVKERVRLLQTQDGGPPKQHLNQPTPKKVLLCLEALNAMIARLMAQTTTEEIIQDTDCHVRIFLTYYSLYDLEMKNKVSDIPSWVSHANFLSLPRLVEAMRNFGPLRLTWEGGTPGEAILSRVKPQVKGGDQSHCFFNCLLRIEKSMALDGLECSHKLSQLLSKVAPDLFRVPSIPAGYRRYKSREEINYAFLHNKPISGFVTKDGLHGACIGKNINQQEEWMGITAEKELFRKINSLTYHKWSFLVESNPMILDHTTIQRCILFLPQLCENGFLKEPKSNGFYTVIDDEWHVLNSSFDFVRPPVDSWSDE